MSKNFRFGNVVSILLTATVAVVMSGCVKQKILVKVKPDGSGTILVSAVYQKNIVDMVDKQVAAQRAQLEKNGMDTSKLEDPLFNEKQFEEQAKMFGTDIEYVKAKKVKTASGRGFIAVYKFKSIDDVKLDLNKLVSPGPKFGPQTPGDDSVSFEFTKGDVAKLQVTIPKMDIPEDSDTTKELPASTPLTEQEKSQLTGPQGAMFGLTGNETTREEVIRKICGDMSISIALQVEGEVVKSNATYKDPKKKGRCTLFAIDFSTMLEDDKTCTRIVNNESPNFIEAIIAEKSVKGIERETKPEITVEFKKK